MSNFQDQSGLSSKIRRRLEDRLRAVYVEISDQSYLHRNHASARSGGGGHYELLVVSEAFDGKSPIERHRLVYSALQEFMRDEIHALALKTITPCERATQGKEGK